MKRAVFLLAIVLCCCYCAAGAEDQAPFGPAAPDALVLEPPGLADALRAHLAGLVANLEGEGHGDVE